MSATKVHITLDEELLETLDRFAADERRSRSGMVQELIRQRDRDAISPAMRDAIKRRAITAVLSSEHAAGDEAARAIATLYELADADFGADDLPDPEEFAEWRKRLWAGTPRYGAEHGQVPG